MTLQPHQGRISGSQYLPMTPDNVTWGWLPNALSRPSARVNSGDTITIDTVSHEGLMDDQGRDPDAFFARFGVDSCDVLDDGRDIAATLERTLGDGPHLISGAVAVNGATPGDLLKIDVLELRLRADYGVVSSRHGLGSLPGEFPETPPKQEGAGREHPELFHHVSTFTPVDELNGRHYGLMDRHGGAPVRFPLDPFMGVMAVGSSTEEPVHSTPPGPHAGNIDVKHLIAGSTLYIPVQVDEAMFATGDPHYAQGNGEIALTAMEASLRGTFRLSVIRRAEAATILGALSEPFAENDTEWIVIGMHVDLGEAMRAAVRSAISFLETTQGMDRATAYAYLSAAGDFEVTQVVDRVQGVHCRIRKRDFRQPV